MDRASPRRPLTTGFGLLALRLGLADIYLGHCENLLITVAMVIANRYYSKNRRSLF
jgi:hypothetical protein